MCRIEYQEKKIRLFFFEYRSIAMKLRQIWTICDTNSSQKSIRKSQSNFLLKLISDWNIGLQTKLSCETTLKFFIESIQKHFRSSAGLVQRISNFWILVILQANYSMKEFVYKWRLCITIKPQSSAFISYIKNY